VQEDLQCLKNTTTNTEIRTKSPNKAVLDANKIKNKLMKATMDWTKFNPYIKKANKKK
jgi:hypothetical protein